MLKGFRALYEGKSFLKKTAQETLILLYLSFSEKAPEPSKIHLQPRGTVRGAQFTFLAGDYVSFSQKDL